MTMERIRLFIDGDAWCALYGNDIQEGKCAFATIPNGPWSHPHAKLWGTTHDPTRLVALDALRAQYPELKDVPYRNDH